MRRAVAALLAMMLLVPAGVAAAQGTTSFGDRVYQAVWCAFLNVAPYYLEVSSDVTCDYEPRAMTREEAGRYYAMVTGRVNHVGDQWACAARKAGLKWTWKQDRRWGKRMGRAENRWLDAVSAVQWPADAKRDINRLVGLALDADYWRRRAYNKSTPQKSLASGDWTKYQKAAGKVSPAANRVRQALGIRHVRTGGNPCKAVNRYERQHD